MNFIRRLYEDSVKDVDGSAFTSKQTVVYIRSYSVDRQQTDKKYELLKTLQTEKNWSVILYCYRRNCSEKTWVPFHRSIITYAFYAEEQRK